MQILHGPLVAVGRNDLRDGRLSAIGQQQSLAVFLQATASACMSGLSPDGRLDGAARQTEGTYQRSFVSDSDRPKSVYRPAKSNVRFRVVCADDGNPDFADPP